MKILPIVLVILAVITAIPAWFVSTRPPPPPELEDQYFGVELDVDDEAEIQSLADRIGKVRIVTWDDDAPQEILVEEVDGEWVIRTRYDYPADGENRLGETAGKVIGLRKLREVTSDEGYHRELGVVDPLDDTAGEEGRGQRATLWNDQGGEVVDVIIGAMVDDQPGKRYAREAGSATVWTTEFEGALSARFIDWVQPNPFDVEFAQVRELVVEDYSIDEAAGTRELRSQTVFERPDGDTDWASLQVPKGEQVVESKIDSIARKVANLRLADIARRRGLDPRELMAHGIFVLQDGVYGNEGVLRVTTAQGYTYHLFFGEVVGSVTGGDDVDADAGSGSDRILATFVSYEPADDESLPEVPAEPEPLAEDADEAAKQARQKALDQRQQRLTQREQHVDDRQEQAERLNAKYQSYFYVIRDADFQALRPGLDALFEERKKEADEEE